MIEIMLVAWMIISLMVVSSVCYVALMQLKFENIFKKQSTWQIRFLVLIVSLTVGIIIACGFAYFFKSIIEIL